MGGGTAKVICEEENIVAQGSVVIEKDRRERNYLHVAAGTLESSLRAGLFTE